MQITFLLLLLFAEEFCTPFLHYAHLSLESLLFLVRHNLICFGSASAIKIFLVSCITLGDVHFVKHCLEIVHFVLVGVSLAVGYFAHTVENLTLCGVGWKYGLAHFKGVVFRVHHSNFFS